MAYSTISKPSLHFNTKLYTGNGTAIGSGGQAITGVGFQPDFTWIKERSSTSPHKILDAVRGATKEIEANTDNAEATESESLTAFGADGFTVGSNGAVNQNSETYVSWNWKAANSSGSSNSDGSITSTVSVNTTAGFSIVKYTGTGSNATIGHGLSTSPSMILIKNRSTNYSWIVYHKSLGATKNLYLDLTNGSDTSSIQFNDTEPTSSVFSVGTSVATNKSGDNLIAYCFAEKTGYSKFGEYGGNGNADGPFVYTGFKPAFVMVKRKDASVNWQLIDNKRSDSGGNNIIDKVISPNATDAEYDEGSANWIADFVSNGFKLRGNFNAWNGNDGNPYYYIYMAFAEEPLVANVGQSIPATAR